MTSQRSDSGAFCQAFPTKAAYCSKRLEIFCLPVLRNVSRIQRGIEVGVEASIDAAGCIEGDDDGIGKQGQLGESRFDQELKSADDRRDSLRGVIPDIGCDLDDTSLFEEAEPFHGNVGQNCRLVCL